MSVCVCTTSLSIHSLLPYLSDSKLCCYEHWGACAFWIFLRYVFRTGNTESYGNSIFSFLRNLCAVPIVVHKCTFPEQNTRVPFSPCAHQNLICRHFDDSHSDTYEVIPHCGFDLSFSDDWVSFYVPVGYLYVFF